MRPRLLPLLLAASVVVASCGNDDATSETDSGESTTTTTQAADETTTTEAGTEATTTAAPATTTTAAPATTTTAPPDDGIGAPSEELVLATNGLADGVRFGDAFEDVRIEMGIVLGPAVQDSGWIDSFSGFGTCPGSMVRVLEWGSLQLFFSDGPTSYGDAGFEHLFHYFYGGDDPADLTTVDGIGVGSTVQQALDAWGADGEWFPAESDDGDSDPFATFAFVRLSEGDDVLFGNAPEGSMTTDAVIQSIAGGFGCGE